VRRRLAINSKIWAGACLWLVIRSSQLILNLRSPRLRTSAPPPSGDSLELTAACMYSSDPGSGSVGRPVCRRVNSVIGKIDQATESMTGLASNEIMVIFFYLVIKHVNMWTPVILSVRNRVIKKWDLIAAPKERDFTSRRFLIEVVESHFPWTCKHEWRIEEVKKWEVHRYTNQSKCIFISVKSFIDVHERQLRSRSKQMDEKNYIQQRGKSIYINKKNYIHERK
jgi:hypothetical protein